MNKRLDYDTEGNVKVETITMEMSDTGMYHYSIAESTASKARLAGIKAQEITKQDLSGMSSDAQAIIKYASVSEIEKIEVTPYEGQKPTEWTDVTKEGVSYVPNLVTGAMGITGIIETGKTLRTALREDGVKITGNDNKVDTQRSDDDQTQVITSNREGSAQGAPQNRNAASVTPESEALLDTECPDGKVLIEGLCYSEATAIERGFIPDQEETIDD